MRVYFEERLRVLTYGAHVGSLDSDRDVSAITAFPDSHSALLENLLCLHVSEQSAVSLFVPLLYRSNSAELLCQILESFLVGFFRHTRIHIGPFIALAFRGMEKVFRGISYLSESPEPKFCVFFLVVCRLQEESRDLFKTRLTSYFREIGILIARLRFACERLEKILFGLGSRVRIL